MTAITEPQMANKEVGHIRSMRLNLNNVYIGLTGFTTVPCDWSQSREITVDKLSRLTSRFASSRHNLCTPLHLEERKNIEQPHC